MLVLRATDEQRNELDGYQSGNSVLRFVEKPGFGWIVGPRVLTDKNFEEIWPKLSLLEKADYIPPPEPDEETEAAPA